MSVDVVLVAGATGGVGSRIVEELRGRGLAVRALVRNQDKGLQVLNQGKPLKGGRGYRGPRREGRGRAKRGELELVVADITQPDTLSREVFSGVRAVVCCTAAIVRPKQVAEGENSYRGMTYFEPEVVDEPKV